MSRKYYTLVEANRLLPEVRKQVDELQEMKRQFERKYTELCELKPGQPDHDDLTFTLECELEFLQVQFKSGLAGFELKGIELKDVDMGLVDFPALMDGGEVLLCWKKGEERVEHYHGLFDGFAGRKKILEL